jgi:hypothetical protein
MTTKLAKTPKTPKTPKAPKVEKPIELTLPPNAEGTVDDGYIGAS